VSESSGSLFEAASDHDAIERAAAAVAPTTAERVDLAMVHTLDARLRTPMFSLLSSLADNKYVLGRRYAEWCTGAPMLESAVAAAAMAQDELGHARSFYPLLRGFEKPDEGVQQVSMEERGWQRRATSAVQCLDQRFVAWADFVAVNALVDTAFTTLLAAAAESAYEPLRQRARKIQQEEAGHWVHAAGWVRRLGSSHSPIGAARPLGSSSSPMGAAPPLGSSDSPIGAVRPLGPPHSPIGSVAGSAAGESASDAPRSSPHATLATALARVWDDAFTWFGRADDPVVAPLADARLLADTPDGLRRKLRARLEPLLDEVGLAEPLLARALPWAEWDPASRRLRSE
jgi:1,2-phenylacetyl-CoA epoxidase catalytic subunit